MNPELLVVACGSYRRGKPTCGDVDVLITHPDGQSHKGVFSKVLQILHQSGTRALHQYMRLDVRGGSCKSFARSACSRFFWSEKSVNLVDCSASWVSVQAVTYPLTQTELLTIIILNISPLGISPAAWWEAFDTLKPFFFVFFFT